VQAPGVAFIGFEADQLGLGPSILVPFSPKFLFRGISDISELRSYLYARTETGTEVGLVKPDCTMDAGLELDDHHGDERRQTKPQAASR
jgi:hypothetical protein